MWLDPTFRDLVLVQLVCGVHTVNTCNSIYLWNCIEFVYIYGICICFMELALSFENLPRAAVQFWGRLYAHTGESELPVSKSQCERLC